MHLETNQLRMVRKALQHQQIVMLDTAKHLSDVCAKGNYYDILVAFGRATHKWADAFDAFWLVAELMGVAPLDEIQEFYELIDRLRTQDLTDAIDLIGSDLVTMNTRLARACGDLSKHLRKYDNKTQALAPTVKKERLSVLLDRARHCRSTWLVADHAYESNEVPEYEVRGLNNPDGTPFFGGAGEFPAEPIEGIAACGARLHRAYDHVLNLIPEVASHDMVLRAFEQRLCMNDTLIDRLMRNRAN